MESIAGDEDKEEILAMIRKHHELTGSKKAETILASFEDYIGRFKKIIPEEYKRVISEAKETGKAQ